MITRANQSTGFYIMRTSVMKELIQQIKNSLSVTANRLETNYIWLVKI